MRLATLVAVTSLVAAACGGGSEPLSLDQYAASIQAVEDRFTEESAEPGASDYQLEGELVGAESLFSDFEARLEGWKDIEPPHEVAELHHDLVTRLDAIQSAVSSYLQKASLEPGEFAFESIGSDPEIRALLLDATRVCVELRRELQSLDASVSFAENCSF